LGYKTFRIIKRIIRRIIGWDAVGAGDFDTLVADYVEDMTFIMPGQTDVLEGRQAFRAALNGLGEILPPGFEITGLRQIEGENEVVSIVEWKSEKVAGSQLSDKCTMGIST
jgi:ketosteroid isomerase-like protein